MGFDLPPVLPPSQQEVVICAISAADQYKVPVTALLAVADTEGGKPGLWVKNTNGTYDVGTMQFNTSYLKELAKHGITTKDVEKSGCYPYYLAAWRISGHLNNDKGDFWRKVANYHSKTPDKNAIYQAKLIPAAAKWDKWFKANMVIPKQVSASSSTPPLPEQIVDIKYPEVLDISSLASKIAFAPIPEGTIPDKFRVSKVTKLAKPIPDNKEQPIAQNTQSTEANPISAMKASSSIQLSDDFIKLSKN